MVQSGDMPCHAVLHEEDQGQSEGRKRARTVGKSLYCGFCGKQQAQGWGIEAAIHCLG